MNRSTPEGAWIRGCARVVVAAALVAISISTAGRAEPEQSADARADPRLNELVSEEQLGETLGEYLEAVSDVSRVQLLAEKPYDQRGLVALNARLPLEQIQRGLARTYRLTWQASSSKPTAYRLYQRLEDQELRRRARERAAAAGQGSVLAQLEHVRSLAALPPDQLNAVAARGDREADQMKSPLTRKMTALAMMAQPATWRAVLQGFQQRVKLADLGPEAVALAKSIVPDSPWPDVAERLGFVAFGLGGTPNRPTIWMVLKVGGHGILHNLLYADGLQRVRQPPAERRVQATLNPSRVPKDKRFMVKVSLRDELLDGAREAAATPPRRPTGAKPLAILLQDLVAQTELPILAECDYRPDDAKWLREQWWLAEDIEEKPLPEALDLLCADFEYEWEFSQGFLILRPRLWFAGPEERSYIVPELDPPPVWAPKK